jgi:hypothetical protein
LDAVTAALRAGTGSSEGVCTHSRTIDGPGDAEVRVNGSIDVACDKHHPRSAH